MRSRVRTLAPPLVVVLVLALLLAGGVSQVQRATEANAEVRAHLVATRLRNSELCARLGGEVEIWISRLSHPLSYTDYMGSVDRVLDGLRFRIPLFQACTPQPEDQVRVTDMIERLHGDRGLRAPLVDAFEDLKRGLRELNTIVPAR